MCGVFTTKDTKKCEKHEKYEGQYHLKNKFFSCFS